MENTRCSNKVSANLTQNFDVKKGFRQGDVLLCDLTSYLKELCETRKPTPEVQAFKSLCNQIGHLRCLRDGEQMDINAPADKAFESKDNAVEEGLAIGGAQKRDINELGSAQLEADS